MVGISAPSQADALFSLVDLLQKPELQDKLRAFQQAEAAAKAAQQSAEAASAEAKAAKDAAEAKINEWRALKPQVDAFNAEKVRHSAWVRRIQDAIANSG